MSFLSKVNLLCTSRISVVEFYKFPSLQAVSDVTEVQLQVYAFHIESIIEDMQIRFKEVFPHIKVYGCWFHFTQRIWMKTSKLALGQGLEITTR